VLGVVGERNAARKLHGHRLKRRHPLYR
jgi:hypothetical protein